MMMLNKVTSRPASQNRATATRPLREPELETERESETQTATETPPSVAPAMESPRLAELLNREESAEREKREQQALALLGRLAAVD